jgi:hypothetical protein
VELGFKQVTTTESASNKLALALLMTLMLMSLLHHSHSLRGALMLTTTGRHQKPSLKMAWSISGMKRN